MAKPKLTPANTVDAEPGCSVGPAKRMAAHVTLAKVLSEANSLNEASTKILREVGQTLGWDLGILWRVDDEAHMMVCEDIWSSPSLKAAKLLSQTRSTRLPPKKGLPGQAWISGEQVWADDYSGKHLPLTPILAKEKMHSAACIPLKVQDRVLGAMEFVSRKARFPDQCIQQTMQAIGAQVGLFMERMRVADALRESEDRYRVLADASSDALVTFDEDGAILFANQATWQTFGYEPVELMGMDLALLIPGYAKYRPTPNEVGPPTPPKYVELSGLHKNGETLDLEATFALYLGKRKKYSTGIIHNISTRNRAQIDLVEAKKKMQSILSSSPGGQIIAESPAMHTLFERVKKAAASYAGILIQGETGSGKECIALALHQQSPRADKMFVARNCAAIPANLFESEMFGHKKGSFTGADRDRKGAFLEADGGTLFLDEIGDLDYDLQTKLLRAIQEKVVRPVGYDHDVTVDPRIICATNKDLRECCKTNEFREDLYYRLVTVVLVVPPLRERREDIIPLALHFLGLASKWSRTLTPEAEERLLQHDWPGNVRELRSMMEHAVIFAAGNEVQVSDLSFPGPSGKEKAGTPASLALADVERRHILRVLKKCSGNKTEAAQLLGLARSTLLIKLKCYQGDTDAAD